MPNWNDPGLVWNGGGIWPFFSGNAGQKSVVLSEIHVTAYRAGRDPVDLTRAHENLAWSTNAVGGFGSCSFTLPGIWRRTKIGHQDLIRVTYGPRILFEGVIEDIGVDVAGDSIQTTIQAFGLARYLDYYSTRRVWSKRDINWDRPPIPLGGSLGGGYTAADLDIATGIVDPTNLALSGVRVSGKSVAWTLNTAAVAHYIAPSGITFVRIMGDGVLAGSASWQGIIGSSSDGSSWTYSTYAGSSSVNQSLVANASQLRVGLENPTGAGTPVAADYYQLTNIRLLGTSLIEDAAGGFYGDTILKDLIALIPGLQQGTIESGSDFTIQAVERSVRDTVRSVVAEVAGYYVREWSVWESGRFDWKTPALDEPQWNVAMTDLGSLNITATIDGIEATSYVLYTDAASGLDAEASAASTDQRNPFVKQGVSMDGLTSPGFPMTSTTSAALASRLSADRGAWPPVTGTITLPILQPVAHASGPVRPAFLIRAGDNIRITDLPRSDYFTPGRDGETFFHISSVDIDIASGTAKLTLEGQTRTSDQLIARLAAVTRTLTG